MYSFEAYEYTITLYMKRLYNSTVLQAHISIAYVVEQTESDNVKFSFHWRLVDLPLMSNSKNTTLRNCNQLQLQLRKRYTT